MCHSSRLTIEQIRQLERMPERWQIKVENAIERVRPDASLKGNARLAVYEADIRDAFDEVVAEMGKSGERLQENARVL
jgi:hypothetical protein